MSISVSEFKETKIYKDLKTKVLNDPYYNGVFWNLKSQSSKSKGSLFEKIYEYYFNSKGFIVKRPGELKDVSKKEKSHFDRALIYDNDDLVGWSETLEVGRKRVEIKGSFGWIDKKRGTISNYKFQQIRPDQQYDSIVFIYVMLDRIEFWEAPKESLLNVILEQDENGKQIHAQHGGVEGTETFWLSGFPENFSSWMTEV
jgi:hypothetical protein